MRKEVDQDQRDQFIQAALAFIDGAARVEDLGRPGWAAYSARERAAAGTITLILCENMLSVPERAQTEVSEGQAAVIRQAMAGRLAALEIEAAAEHRAAITALIAELNGQGRP